MPEKDFSRKFCVYDRRKKALIEERVFGSAQINFAYNTKFGRGLSSFLLKRKFVSRLGSLYYKSGFSRRDILPFITKYQINMDEFREPAESFRDFNSFFTRQIRPEARPIDCDSRSLIAPCDSRLQVHRIAADTVISAKGQLYTLPQLLQDPAQADVYRRSSASHEQERQAARNNHSGSRHPGGRDNKEHSLFPRAVTTDGAVGRYRPDDAVHQRHNQPKIRRRGL